MSIITSFSKHVLDTGPVFCPDPWVNNLYPRGPNEVSEMLCFEKLMIMDSVRKWHEYINLQNTFICLNVCY